MVVSVTLFPFPIGFHDQNGDFSHAINIVPLISIIENFNQIGMAYDGDVLFMVYLIIRNVGGNILLLMPLGFLAPILWKKFRGVKAASLLGLFVSVTIELLQLFQRYGGGWGRITDIDDVIFNVLGAVIGYLAYVFIFKIGDQLDIKVFKDFNRW
jgi:glycopeptide antibiotics resistance protein